MFRTTCPFCGLRLKRPLDPGIRSSKALDVEGYAGATVFIVGEQMNGYRLVVHKCPGCEEIAVDVQEVDFDRKRGELVAVGLIPVLPQGRERPVPSEVPEALAQDYREATRVMSLSLKAAATMARRCLQATLRAAYPNMPNSKKRRFRDEIQWVMDHTDLDQDIKDSLDALRDAGNFGAHPSNDGLNVVYELSEEDLEVCLSVLDELFEELYVTPARRKAGRAALKQRLGAAKASP